MEQVYKSKPKDNKGQMTAVGAGIGAAYGNPQAGAGIGSTVSTITKPRVTETIEVDGSAMDRRLQAMNSDTTLQTLQDAISTLPEMPDVVRQEYEKPLLAAYDKASQQRGQR